MAFFFKILPTNNLRYHSFNAYITILYLLYMLDFIGAIDLVAENPA